MKILVLGSGGRENALVHTFKRQGHLVYCFPGNPGTEKLCETFPRDWNALDLYDFNRMSDLVKQLKIDLTVVGPEHLLNQGIANHFAQQSLPLFGPVKEAAILETSKAWAKQFMSKYGIPTARYTICHTLEQSIHALKKEFPPSRGVVIKPSGLTGGKGVVCCNTQEEAEASIEALMERKLYGEAGAELLIEEKLIGQELSLLAFCDGSRILPMIASQDHKRLYDHDQGPNTGGMGAYAPVPLVNREMMQNIHSMIIDKTLTGLKNERINYRGVLYFGLMLTKEGPMVLEYNSRFGDPETQALLPLLKSDLAKIMLACCHGELHLTPLEWSRQYSCCVVMASEGYPDHCSTGQVINGLDEFDNRGNVLLFQAGTKKNEKGEIISTGGRILGVTGLGDTLIEAVQQAYQGIDQIIFPGGHYRKDIAFQGLKVEETSFASRS